MIDSFLEERPSGLHSDQDEAAPVDKVTAHSDRWFLDALPIIGRILRRRRLVLHQDDALDLAQGITLRLLKWRQKHREKSEKMSASEWNAFTARTSFNELNRYFVRAKGKEQVYLEDLAEMSIPSREPDTGIEIFTLVRSVWQAICRLTLRQRRALLLHSQELIIYLLRCGVTNRELASVLDLSESEWNEIRDQLPISDVAIAKLTRTERSKKRRSGAGSIKKARHEARVRLEGVRRK